MYENLESILYTSSSKVLQDSKLSPFLFFIDALAKIIKCSNILYDDELNANTKYLFY